MPTTKLPDSRRIPPPEKTWPPGPNEGDHSSSEKEYFWQNEKEKDMQNMSHAQFMKKYLGTFRTPSDPSGEKEQERITRYYKDKERPQYNWPKGTDKVTYNTGFSHDDGADAAKYSAWYETKFPPPKDSNPYKEKQSMSNKFLPFVVENSTPLHMFKTLLSRSKGINQVLIASTFNLILNKDIKELRKIVKELPEMPLEKIYEELLIKFSGYRVKGEVLATYQTISQFFPSHSENPLWGEELNTYTVNDIMLFFCSMAYANNPTDKYTDYPYNLIMEKDSVDPVLENLKAHVTFDDNGTPVTFDNAIELRCFILYHGLFKKLMDPDALPETYKATITTVTT